MIKYSIPALKQTLHQRVCLHHAYFKLHILVFPPYRNIHLIRVWSMAMGIGSHASPHGSIRIEIIMSRWESIAVGLPYTPKDGPVLVSPHTAT